MNQHDQADPLRERISALADGELDADEAQGVIDALLRDGPHRQFWSELHAAGDCLRSDESAAAAADGFIARFSERLAAEPVVLAPQVAAPARSKTWLRYGLPGASIAAGIAMVLWMAIPQMTRPDADVADAGAATAPVQAQPAAAVTEVPPAELARPAAAQMDPEQVREYLTAHQGSVQAASLTIISSKADAR